MSDTTERLQLTNEEYAVLATQDKGPEAQRIITAFTIIATLFVLLRVWIRLLYRSGIGLGVDDVLLTCAVVFNWTAYVLYFTAIKHGGIGRHLVVVILDTPTQYRNALLYMYAVDFVYVTVIALAKVSILVMYYRVFQSPFTKRGMQILGGVTGVWWLATILAAVFQCTPIRAAFDIDAVAGSKCMTKSAYFLGNGIPNIVTDALVLCLPVIEIRRLRVKMSQKVAIGAVFMLGILVVIASICRLVAVVHLFETRDLTYQASDFLIWNSIECNIALVSAALPQMRPVLHWLREVVGISKHGSTQDTINSFGDGCNDVPAKPAKEEMVDVESIKESIIEEIEKSLDDMARSVENNSKADDSLDKRRSRWQRLKSYANEGSRPEIPARSIKVTHELAWEVETDQREGGLSSRATSPEWSIKSGRGMTRSLTHGSNRRIQESRTGDASLV